MSKPSRCLLTSFVLLSAIAPVCHAADSLTADVEVIYPVPSPGGRSGGVAHFGGAKMERLDASKSPDGKAMLRLSGEKAPVQGAWWFPNDRRPTDKQALVGDKQGRLVFDLQAQQPVESDLNVQWRVDGKSAQWVHSGHLKLGPDQTTHVELPIPPLSPDAKINGLILSFSKPGDYEIHKLSLARLSAVSVNAIDPAALREALQVKIAGRTAPGVDAVTLRFTPETGGTAIEKTAHVTDGQFELPITAEDLPPGMGYQVTAEPNGQPAEVSPSQRLFVYPAITGKKCPVVTRNGADLIRDGKRFGFVGTNYTRFALGLSNRANYEMIAKDLLQMKSFGLRVARVSIDIGMIEPELGVTADDPRYKGLMKQHDLDPAFVDQLDYYVRLAGELGIYTVIDWHGFATDPYRYFLGGNDQQKKAGEPGTAIAYNAASPTKGQEFDLSNPKHVESLLDAHRWAASHFKGNPNVLGIEIPFNEPHTKYMAVEANWRRITDECAKTIFRQDPDRLTFILGPSYSHNNVIPSATWLPPDLASGGAPHMYQANGPVPLRPDAKKFKEPWLARQTEGTFGWGFTAMLMPFSAVHYPFYNGETGAHGAEMVLPDRTPVEATSLLIEAQLVQEYASGMAGRCEWTMWGNKSGFIPFLDVYHTLFNRFAPVFESGPIDRQKADVLFLQSRSAIPDANGYNYACIPFAKAVLDLHLPFVHYMTGEQFRFNASAEMSVGLEQVVGTADAIPYKAIIVDQQNLDPQVLALVKKSGIPALMLDRADALTDEQLAAFLQKSGVGVDTKTPVQIQLAEGPAYLIAYRRLDGGQNPTRIYPQLHRQGEFELVDEKGASVFKGTADALKTQGIEVNLPLWRSAIFQIK